MSSEKEFPSKENYREAFNKAKEGKTDLSFMKEFKIDDSLCDDLIDFFEKTPNREDNNPYYTKKPGAVGYAGQIRTEHKESLDLGFSSNLSRDLNLPEEFIPFANIYDRYVQELHKCTKQYIEEYPYIIGPMTRIEIREATNIQHYPPGGGFKTYHCESASDSLPQASRCLVFMTYLNTVTDDGGTHFVFQDKVINAVKGKTLIWPANWPWTHKGVISKTQEKYIITGWYSYTNLNAKDIQRFN